MWFEDFFCRHPRKILWGLCFVIIGMLSYGLFSAPLIPYLDGQLEMERSFVMKSLWRAGSYTGLLQTFNTPQISVLTPQTILYMLDPYQGDNLKFYVVLLLIFTYVPLAWGIFQLSKLVNRPQWAPALFLLSAGNNLSFDYPHVLDLNTQMMALLTISLVFQLRWHAKPTFLHAAVYGASLGLGFWVQPQTAFLGTAIFVCTECFFIMPDSKSPQKIPGFLVAIGALLIVALPAVWTDKARQILVCFNLSAPPFSTSIFPLSLTIYYDLEMLLVAAVVVLAGFKCLSPTAVTQQLIERREGKLPVKSSPAYNRILQFSEAALAFGLIITFANQIPVESWMFVLPMCWILILALIENFGFGLASINSFAASAFCFITMQIFLGWHNERFVPNLSEAPDVAEDWSDRLPLDWSTFQDFRVMNATAETIREFLPNTGVVSLWSSSFLVNAPRLRWTLNQYPNSYYFVNPVTTSSLDYDPQLLSAQAIVIYDPAKLAGTPIEKQSIHALSDWLEKRLADKPDDIGSAKVILDGAEAGTIYFLKKPLSLTDWDELKKCREDAESGASSDPSHNTIDTHP